MDQLRIGETVAFYCYIYGPQKGRINNFLRCVTNGQKHAVVRITLEDGSEVDCKEPLVNLSRI